MTGQLSYSITEAAERLGGPFTVDWLRGHLEELPHISAGRGRGRAGRIGFSEAHLQQIIAMFSVTPTAAPAADDDRSAIVTRRRAS